MRPTARSAFTLIELLVVITIIAVLSVLMLSAVSAVRNQAKDLLTANRIRDALTACSSMPVGAGQTPAQALAGSAGLGGVSVLITKSPDIIAIVHLQPFWQKISNSLVAKDPSQWFTQTDYDKPYIFGYPWDQPDRITARVSSYWNHAVDNDNRGPACSALTETAAVDADGIQTVSLPQLSPLRTVELLSSAGVFADAPSSAVYFTDRGINRPWNDAWGRPLVLAYGVFQPPPLSLSSGGKVWRDAWRTDAALKQYGYGFAVYLSAGSIGPQLPAGISEAQLTDALVADWTTPATDTLQKLWDAINTTCQGSRWNGSSFANPPWNGTCQVRSGGNRCSLTAPQIVH